MNPTVPPFEKLIKKIKKKIFAFNRYFLRDSNKKNISSLKK